MPNCKLYTYKGKKRTSKQLANLFKITLKIFNQRLRNGWVVGGSFHKVEINNPLKRYEYYKLCQSFIGESNCEVI